MEKITAELRVTDLRVRPHSYGMLGEGEVIDVKAQGEWDSEGWKYPTSLHITVYPGCGAIPHIGDNVTITVSQT